MTKAAAEKVTNKIELAKKESNLIMNTVVRGIDQIMDVTIRQYNKYTVDSQGALVKRNQYYLTTNGINFEDIFLL
jgi:hypothetical protein